jgi:NAD(P)-dependent dehydrogenase (short-subunit alcohol dehydrogenase family)
MQLLQIFGALVLAVAALWAVVYLRIRSRARSHTKATAPVIPPFVSSSSATMDFTGKVAIVTGGGTGLGREISLNLARRGAKVVLASRSPEHLDAVAAEIKAFGGEAMTFPLDVRDPTKVQEMVDKTVERFGRVDVLVNNAAGNFVIPAEKLTPNGWNAVIGIVLNGTWYCSSAVGKQMIKQGSGSIVNIVANYASSGAPGVIHSGAAKAGVLNMTRSLAVEWGQYGIRVNALAPGAMVTSAASKNLGYDTPEVQEKIRKSIPLGRLTSAEEMAAYAVFLASDQAAYITGDVMTADGGLGLPRGLMELYKQQ